MKNKKFIVVCSGSLRIPVDEDELLKVYQAISSGEPAMMRQGWFKPSYFIGVVEDEEKMKRLYEDLKYDIRDGKVTEFPKYKDLFPELREQIRQIGTGHIAGPIRGSQIGIEKPKEPWEQ